MWLLTRQQSDAGCLSCADVKSASSVPMVNGHYPRAPLGYFISHTQLYVLLAAQQVLTTRSPETVSRPKCYHLVTLVYGHNSRAPLDTSSRTPTSMRSFPLSASPAPHAMRSSPSESLELSSATTSPPKFDIAAAVTTKPYASSAQGLLVPCAGAAAESPALTDQADVSAERQSASLQHSLGAGPYSPKFSGSPVAGLCRTGPQFPVRLTKKQKVRHRFPLQVSERRLSWLLLDFLLLGSNRWRRP